MSFSRCLDIWGLIGEMRSDPVSRLPQNTRYASGVLICFLVGTEHSQVAIELYADCRT